MADATENEQPKKPVEPVGGTLLLEHAYAVTKRLSVGSLYAEYEVTRRPFDKTVRMRLYRQLRALSLGKRATDRIERVIERGGDGDIALDVGEMEEGMPFLILRPPRGEPVTEWLAQQPDKCGCLRELGLGLLKVIETLTEAQRRELSSDCLYVRRQEGRLILDPYVLGDHPTRGEVRRMKGLLQRDLVLGFPPECFAPDSKDASDLEQGVKADAYRWGALLYAAATGDQPLFRSDGDVTDAVARLVNDLEPYCGPLDTGDAALDAAVMATLERDPAKRPGWQDLQTVLQPSTDALEPPPRPTRIPPTSTRLPRGPGLSVTVRALIVTCLIVATALLTFVWSNQPPEVVNVVVTSEPSAVEFERVGDGDQVETVGRTPFILEEVPLGAVIQLRPVYNDGERGAQRDVSTDQLQIVDGCRTAHFKFE